MDPEAAADAAHVSAGPARLARRTSSWSGYHSDVMGEAARGWAGGPPGPGEEVDRSLIAG